MPNKLYVANLSHQVNEAELGRLFAGFGVQAVKIFAHLATADPTAVGLVEVDTEQHGQSAIAALNGTAYRGSALSVAWAKPAEGERPQEARMFESMNIPGETEGQAVCEPRGPRRGDFGDRSGSGA